MKIYHVRWRVERRVRLLTRWWHASHPCTGSVAASSERSRKPPSQTGLVKRWPIPSAACTPPGGKAMHWSVARKSLTKLSCNPFGVHLGRRFFTFHWLDDFRNTGVCQCVSVLGAGGLELITVISSADPLQVRPFTTHLLPTEVCCRVVVGSAGGGRADADSKVDFTDQVRYACLDRSVATDRIRSRPQLGCFRALAAVQGF